MSKKILYLTGAGASCNTMPLVQDFSSKIYKYLDLMDTVLFPNGHNSERDVSIPLYNDLKWLVEESKSHASIDTMAKMFLLSGVVNKLVRLKNALAAFLYGYQGLRGIDKRYNQFLASILERVGTEIIIPDNLKILTWNYDTQFEVAYSKIDTRDGEEVARTKIQSFPNGEDYSISIDKDKFSIIHLNGSFEFFYNTESETFQSTLDIKTSNPGSVLSSTNEYYSFINNKTYLKKSLLNFAWEDNEYTQLIFPQVYESIKDTQIVVVIGYSFPFFNREIDKKIFENMPNLEKIYIQCADQNESVKERVEALFGRDIDSDFCKLISDKNQFYIPHEF
jgi:hypothetical protein